jgi:hypothetical protein
MEQLIYIYSIKGIRLTGLLAAYFKKIMEQYAGTELLEGSTIKKKFLDTSNDICKDV